MIFSRRRSVRQLRGPPFGRDDPGGQVNYLPNVNDGDQRLLAQSGADFQGTYSSRIANPRYTPTILTQQITPPIQCLVPNVKNRPLATARRMILARHCSVGTVRRAYSKRIKKGRVISQTPKPSTLLPNHGKLRLVVSRGRKP
ncbi:MAG: PASTA domain-containing protein [Gaiellaceae bacterium]